jgi:ElaB/YqjD/DUF883 family membrane-anchored ribosome-binding protein
MNSNRDSERIRRDIHDTQQQISRTVDDIRYRMSPHRMMDDAKDRLRRAPREASEGLVNRIRENPIPAAIVGLGLFLMMRGERSRDAGWRDFVDEGLVDYGYDGYATGYESSDRDGVNAVDFEDIDFERTGRSRMSEAADTAREKIYNAREKTAEMVDSVSERAQELGASTRYRARHLADRTRYRTRTARREILDVIDENPLILGAAGAVLGTIIGLAIPETERENRLMGEKRDELKERAVGLAEEGVHRAREVADAAKDAATTAVKQELKSQSGTSSSLGSENRIR